MRLESLYRMEFDYPQAWSVALAADGNEGQHLFLAEGRCAGRLSGSMQGANHPRRRGDGTYCPDFDGVITTDDAASVLFIAPEATVAVDTRPYGCDRPGSPPSTTT